MEDSKWSKLNPIRLRCSILIISLSIVLYGLEQNLWLLSKEKVRIRIGNVFIG